MAGISRVGSAFSTLPFDGIDNVRNVFFHDDFLGADDSNVFFETANGNWLTTTTAVVATPGTAGHPGQITLEASFITPGVTADPDFVVDANGLYLATIVKVPVLASDAPIAFGLNDNTTDVLGDVNDTFVGLTLQTTGKFELEYLAAGEVDFDITYVAGDWVLLELAITDAGAFARVTTEDGQETRYIDGAAVPGASLAVLDATGTVVVDAWHERYSRPEQAANGGISWLGASGA